MSTYVKSTPTTRLAYECDQTDTSQAFGTYGSFYIEGAQAPLLNKDHMLINIIGGTQCLVILFGALINGRLLDAGHSRKVLGVGNILLIIGSFSLGGVRLNAWSETARYAYIWLFQGFVMALGMACFFVSSSQSKSAVSIPFVALLTLILQLPAHGSDARKASHSALSPAAPVSAAHSGRPWSAS